MSHNCLVALANNRTYFVTVPRSYECYIAASPVRGSAVIAFENFLRIAKKSNYAFVIEKEHSYIRV